jgi:hypothetical protein
MKKSGAWGARRKPLCGSDVVVLPPYPEHRCCFYRRLSAFIGGLKRFFHSFSGSGSAPEYVIRTDYLDWRAFR